MMSTYSFMRSSSPTAARSVVSTTWTAASGNPAVRRPSRTQAAIARFECPDSEPPRRMHALPDLSESAAASAVTLGRDS